MNQHQQRLAWKALAVIELVFGLVLSTILHTGLYVDVAASSVFIWQRECATFALATFATNFTRLPSSEL
jgi:hypothetical protein